MRVNWITMAAFAAALPVLCFATSTKTWLQSSAADFEKGDLHGLAVRSDGRLTLAPESHEVCDPSLAYVWAMARDSRGVIYAGGGPGAKVYRVVNGKSSLAAQFDALEVHAIAINNNDEVFAATSPDGRIYRIPATGKPVEFYNPHQKYIWALSFDAQGNLFAATGDQGEIHRIAPDGHGAVFFKSEETHIRSLVIGKSLVYAGTDPSGLILRINAKGEGFVLFQMPKPEVTALALAPDGALFAADAGSQAVAAPPAPASVIPPAPAASGTIVIGPPRAPQSIPPQTTFSGGSDIYRIQSDGYPQQFWKSSRDVVYALSVNANGQPIAATGNRGALLRIDSPTRSTTLLTLPTTQILALLPGGPGEYLAATGNIGKIYRIGPQLEKRGTWESEAFDSGAFTQWGRVISYGDEQGGKITLEARSGNQERPDRNWSAWSAPLAGKMGGRTGSPAARFLQLRATLTSSGGTSTPELDSVEAAYRAQNAAPLLGEIEITPANYKFPGPTAAAAPSRSPAAIVLPAIGHPSSGVTSSDLDTSALTYSKGWLGSRWTAADANGDPLAYTVEIRGVNEHQWKPMKDHLGDRHYSFDTTAFPDGEYRLRVTASDQPGNTKEDALTGEIVSAPFTIDNTPPRIADLRVARGQITWRAEDALSVIARAEYSIDGGDWMLVEPKGKLSDSLAQEYSLSPGLGAGEHTVAVRLTDEADNTAVEKVIIR